MTATRAESKSFHESNQINCHYRRQQITSNINNRLIIQSSVSSVHKGHDVNNNLSHVLDSRNSYSSDGARPRLSQTTTISCPMSWDGLMCWPESEAGTLVSRPCLAELQGVEYDTSFNVTRLCQLNGTWIDKSNYDMCRPTSDYLRNHLQNDGAGAGGGGVNVDIMPNIITAMSGALRNAAIIYYVGYGLSMIVLVIALLIFVYYKELHCLRNIIHMNLMITYLLFNITWIATFTLHTNYLDEIKSNRQQQTTHSLSSSAAATEAATIETITPKLPVTHLASSYQSASMMSLVETQQAATLFTTSYHANEGPSKGATCYMFVLLTYIISTNFFWMFVEGLYLHALVVRTLRFNDVSVSYYMFIGWVMPAIIVSLWTLLKGYYYEGTHAAGCPWQFGHIAIDLVYIVPIIVLLLMNTVFMGEVIFALVTRFKTSANMATVSQYSSYKAAAKALTLLIPLLGGTHVLFIWQPRSMWALIILAYLKAFLLSSQGFVVAVLYCFANTEIAVFGCLHGMLNEMYGNVERYEQSSGTRVELVIVSGDCQTVRHQHDLKCVSIPPKFYQLGDFHNYYSGKQKIPKLTIFVGGNHEASNYLSTLPYGGWVCENFYYMGHANVIRYKGLRIGGISGIYNYHSKDLGRFERLPYDQSTMRSAYHTRYSDIYRLHQLAPYEDQSSDRMDIFLSHDWPEGIYNYGNYKQLCRFKPHFTDEINQNRLGNPMTKTLIGHLKPIRWFAAHLHCKFEARVQHDANKPELVTEFLSLDKIKPRSKFMEVIDIEATRDFDQNDDNLYYDAEWLAVLRKTNYLTSTMRIPNIKCPHYSNSQNRPTEQDIEEVHELMKQICDEKSQDDADQDNNSRSFLRIPYNFTMSEPVVYDRPEPSIDESRSQNFQNPQTESFCSRLSLKDPISDFVVGSSTATDSLNVTTNDDRNSSSSDSLDQARPDKKVKVYQQEGCLEFYIDSKGRR